MKININRFWETKWGKLIRSFFTESLFIRFIAAWCIASSIAVLSVHTGYDTLLFIKDVRSFNFILILICSMLSIHLLGKAFEIQLDYYMLPISVCIYSVVLIAKNHNFYFSLGILIVLAFIGYYILKDDILNLGKIKLNNTLTIGLVCCFSLVFVLYVGGITTLRYLNYSTSTYDFGIFAQMFYHMKETFLPNTTCERTMLLSHFAIHFSPIFYVLLPGYFLFPSPVYLQMMQAVVLASSVIPLFLLARHFSLSNKITICICAAFCFYPALAGGCFYDIHENMFLSPLILWLLLFIEKQKWPLMYLFALLTCMVKEDAFIYVASIAVFVFIVKKKRLHGAVLLLCSVAYFVGASFLLKMMGQGIMSGRFENFISDPKLGLLSVFKTIVLDPAYILCQVFNQEKIIYIILMLLPLGFLPLLNRKLSQLILLVPFLLINLMSNYPYQHSIFFQYNFGSTAIFFYLAVVNIKEIGGRIKKYAVPFMVSASVILFISNISSYTDNIKRYITTQPQIKQLNTFLEAIPEEASVQASGYFVPKLSKHKELYDVQYVNMNPAIETEYIVLDLRAGNEKNAQIYIKNYKEQGYQSVTDQEGLICILKK